MADIQIPMTSSKGVRLRTSETYCENNIAVIPELEELTVAENGEYTPTKVGYNKITVDVPIPDGYIVPEGTLSITENGTHGVTEYASVEVAVPGGGATEVDIFPSQTVEGFALDETFGAYTANSPVNFVINEGETYYVEWDGTTYTCTGKAGALGDLSVMYLGNDTLLGGESDEPFTVGYYVALGTVGFIATDTATSHTIRIYQKSSATSTDERVKYVTFMNGATELISYPVIVGDTVKNPVTAGLIDTPTKEQTESITYTFSGWSLTDGGSVSSSALTNVTEDRTVYAAFRESARLYTVSFYDGDTLINTEQVVYGSSSTYTYAKEDYIFTGWSPEPTNITGDLDCYAQWIEGIDLESASWQRISEISAANEGELYFEIGETKSVAISGTVGTIELDATYYVYILGFNHNSEVEGNGIHFGTFKSAASNGIDLCLVDSKYGNSDTSGTKYFNMNHWGNPNHGGWAGCDMRYDILGSTDVAPSVYGAKKTTSSVGYDATATCATNPVENTLMAALPADLRAVMKPMTKYTNNTGNSGDTEDKVTVTTDYLPLLAEFEIFGERKFANSYEQNKQKQYDYYAAGNSKLKYRHSKTTSTAYWWGRSARYSDYSSFCDVSSSGKSSSFTADNAVGLAPIFLV